MLCLHLAQLPFLGTHTGVLRRDAEAACIAKMSRSCPLRKSLKPYALSWATKLHQLLSIAASAALFFFSSTHNTSLRTKTSA